MSKGHFSLLLGFVIAVGLMGGTAAPVFCWTDQTDHGSANVPISANTWWGGPHYNIGTLTMNSGIYLYINTYNGTGDMGKLRIEANVINIQGQVYGAGQGFGGGGAGLQKRSVPNEPLSAANE